MTSPLRAPFTRYRGTGGPAEVMEETRDAGTVRHAIGELLSCPFCLDMWIATGLVIGLRSHRDSPGWLRPRSPRSPAQTSLS